MKTIKFGPINELRKETHNVEDYKIIDYEFNNAKLKLYKDFNLVIFTNLDCNGNCVFCMNKYNKKFKSCSILAKDEYLKKIEDLLIKLKELNPTVSIGGGESTKSDLLVPILRLLKKHNYRCRTFSTNGTGLLDKYEDKLIIAHLDENDFKNINLSIAHFDESKNNRIMSFKSDPITTRDVKQIANFAKANGMYLRASCVLVKNGVDNLTKAIEYFKYYLSLGIDNSLFREQVKINGKKIGDIFVDIDSLTNELKNNKNFSFIRKMEGLYYDVDVYKFSLDNEMHLVKVYDEKEISKDIVKDIIIYPDGDIVYNFTFEGGE